MTEFAPLSQNDFDVEKDGVTLNVQRFANDTAMVMLCDPETGRNSKGPFQPYYGKPMGEVMHAMHADGWTIKATMQMVVEHRSNGYNNCTVSGVCSPDVTVEDVEKRFYHWYFGGRNAWVKDGRFGCTIHTD